MTTLTKITPTRIYLVTINGAKRLVRASHPASALMHVARHISTVGVATQQELIDGLAAGISVESAGVEQAAPQAAHQLPAMAATEAAEAA